MVIIDNNISSFAYQLGNGIPILPYFGKNQSDRELKELMIFLEEIFKIPGKKRGKILRKYFMYDLFDQSSGSPKVMQKVMQERLDRLADLKRDILF